MVEDHSDSETGNKSPLHGLICTHPSSRWKEANVLFNDVLNTFCLWLYGVKPYGKGPLRKRERKPAIATLASLYD